MVPDFVPFPKLARLSRECVITEKIDGNNAQVHITDEGEVYAGSRTRWLLNGDDNFGFAEWVWENKEELLKLGPGSHFGEWWGAGIKRGYGREDKVFSLFNTHRWSDDAVRPACCSVVPVLYLGTFDTGVVNHAIEGLAKYGSVAQPGFMKPEGVVVFHTASSTMYKKTCEKDEKPKGSKE
jgi:hypothetical protein